ncbi:MAG: CDP-alcohol phosphatidyltransferase family protein [Ignavibacteria bacterium]|nr:CDP-alcohol phosphatidyltransferase family protein [Ignavibacteria bacterium]MBI3765486.1 CDP-alcohol phosphatidyltransferase family protein [Ignavibacteriales bacterium]
MGGRIWTISNILSFSRVLLVIPIAMLVVDAGVVARWYAVGLIVIAAFTDLFDGLIARKLNQVTEFGKIIDPIADKIAVGVVGVILTLQGSLPTWFLIIVLARDVAIFVGGMYIKNTKGITLQSNLVGKWAVTVIAGLILVTIINAPEIASLKVVLLYASMIMLLVSFTLYCKRFMDVMNQTAPAVK